MKINIDGYPSDGIRAQRFTPAKGNQQGRRIRRYQHPADNQHSVSLTWNPNQPPSEHANYRNSGIKKHWFSNSGCLERTRATADFFLKFRFDSTKRASRNVYMDADRWKTTAQWGKKHPTGEPSWMSTAPGCCSMPASGPVVWPMPRMCCRVPLWSLYAWYAPGSSAEPRQHGRHIPSAASATKPST